MSSLNVSNLNEIQKLNYITGQITFWGLMVCFVFGIPGFILNIYVFLRPALRKNPCAMYFLSSSVTGFIIISVTGSSRILQYTFNIDPTYYLLELCKIQYYISFSSRGLTAWFLVLACIDRYLRSSSNARIRQWSSFKVASYAIPITIILVFLAYIHVPIFYKINTVMPICAGQPGVYRLFLGAWHIIAYGSGPPLFMFLFSFLTIRRIRNRRIVIANTIHVHQDRRNINNVKDRNLLRMALVQCICIGFTTSCFSFCQLYISITTYQVKDSFQIAKENLIQVLGGVISTIGHSSTFYLYTITSQMFRQHLPCQKSVQT